MAEGYSVYLHIPFCVRKCPYCDFVSYVPHDYGEVNIYVAALKREMKLRFSGNAGGETRTLYIGGGTPSYLSGPDISDLIAEVGKYLPFAADAEVTVEINPGTADREKLASFKAAGANRLSVGAQSFDDELLAAMGRIHCSEDTKETVRLAQEVGFANINLDLIFGLPGQSLDEWQDTLACAVELHPTHISTYALEVSPLTPWGREDPGLPAEDEVAAMYIAAIEFLTGSGYEHYEISNFALPGFQCRHNLVYWEREDYLGLGVGACSFLHGIRTQNTCEVGEYVQAVFKGNAPFAQVERLDPRAAMGEAMFLGLRLIAGVDLSLLEARFGLRAEEVFLKEIDYLLKKELVKLERGRLSLTRKALPVANLVFEQFV